MRNSAEEHVSNFLFETKWLSVQSFVGNQMKKRNKQKTKQQQHNFIDNKKQADVRTMGLSLVTCYFYYNWIFSFTNLTLSPRMPHI